MKVCFEVAIILAVLLNGAIAVSRENKVFVPATKDLFDFDSSEDLLRNERYARHVEIATESVLQHVMNELKKYPKMKGSPQTKLVTVAKMIQKALKQNKRLKEELKKKIKQKLQDKINTEMPEH